jgi:hypothetical protein
LTPPGVVFRHQTRTVFLLLLHCNDAPLFDVMVFTPNEERRDGSTPRRLVLLLQKKHAWLAGHVVTDSLNLNLVVVAAAVVRGEGRVSCRMVPALLRLPLLCPGGSRCQWTSSCCLCLSGLLKTSRPARCRMLGGCSLRLDSVEFRVVQRAPSRNP